MQNSVTCLPHDPTLQEEYLAALTPGDNIDLRGCIIKEEFWNEICSSVNDGEGPKFGRTRFNEAIFDGDIVFDDAKFGDADFRRAVFTGGPSFVGPHFADNASFEDVQFGGMVNFEGGRYEGTMFFERAQFAGDVVFSDLTFTVGSWFNDARFSRGVSFLGCRLYGGFWFTKANVAGTTNFMDCSLGPATFVDTVFAGETNFDRASFAGGCNLEKTRINPAPIFGPVVCEGPLNLTDAQITAPVVMDVSATEIWLIDATLQESVTLRARYAAIDLTRARLFYPCTITTDHAPSERPDESRLALRALVEVTSNQPVRNWVHDSATISIVSLEGVDVSFLLLSDVNLVRCEFAGAHHLDQLRLEGYWNLGESPVLDRRGIFPFQPTRRLVIEEERKWRALRNRRDYEAGGWGRRPEREQDVPGLATLTTTYRQLRKAREDAKDEPGAADFYYGEMEMRRHSRAWSDAERWLLQAYWLLSGYGLRASRALGWLVVAMMATILLMMGFGLPQDSPKQEATGTVPPGGGRVTFEIDKEDPRNPTGDHFTGERFDKALSVTLNSVVFRSSGQDLTTAGGYIEMASRFSEPVLLGLAALAIRGRVKR
ncbi:pentapeptide repeat-containing protein [Streptomyces ferrugineus]|uniref:Pentapeptide repeat-containing protein n=1 Tax=Streptomyces ferrugineus TaxID=1413221 RepID=A0A7M2SVA2_9ACTN|nr:pentapeptide repeat-containing protein [Streptomyces ferrugineus]QOV40192.1 pentapeptide repeat-containing protein [Streptomyces ferrugineus]